MDNYQIWHKVSTLMEAQGLKMPTLAKKASISRQSLYNLKKNGSANTETIRAIATALGVGPGYLME